MALAARAAAVGCVLLALAASAVGAGSRSHSPAPAPAPSTDCFAIASSLMDCLPYVSPGSTVKQPPQACCGEVKTAVADPVAVSCLCQLAGDKSTASYIDMKRVLALPAACGESNTVFSQCNLAGAPTQAPTPSEGGSSSGGTTASPPRAAAASSPMTATALVAAVAAPLLAYCYLF
ncbi:hypothetical protein U9M48_007554 [Paspalum notatum var. saurae]|uniref:Bifunctional inhibitor/plant lipid transfer protein/seed storage helical domain-containing protein n=1 Tax=Paspalum notatum var. saurae TaxID=547442 RepID=A0AAQ3Q1V0_PASNO